MTTSSTSLGLSSGQLNVGSDGTTTITGLTTGNINVQALEQALVAAYSVPETQLQSQQTAIQTQISDYQAINTAFASLQSAADALALPNGWSASTVTSSASTVATATTSSGATPGSISFTVSQLAAAGVTASSGQVASTSSVVATDPLLVSAGGTALGFTSLASTSLALGTHNVSVTQSSTAAIATGVPIGSSVTFASPATLSVTVDGQALTVTIAQGTYTASQLAAAITSQGSGQLQATANADGSLSLSTTDEGSEATMQVTGGSALSSLGLTASGTLTGSDAIVTVDGQANTVTHVVAGQSLTLDGANGATVTATASTGHLTAGTMSGSEVSVGSGTLASVVSAINGANVGVSATAVSTGSGYRLLLSGTTTGAGTDPTIDGSSFSGLGALTTVTTAQDASIQVGGSSGFAVTSATNQVSGLLPGVSIALQAVSSTPVTLTVAADATTAATNVSTLVSAINTATATINQYAGYNASTQTGGPLMGDSALTSLSQQVLASLANVLGTSSTNLGLTLNADGTLSFDQSTFQTAYSANPSGVAAAFTQGGTLNASDPAYANSASLVYAGDGAQAGNYDVTITQSATQPVATGSVVSGGTVPAGGDNLTVSVGGSSVSYSASAGQSLSDVAAGLNAAMVGAGLGVTATVVTSGSDSQLVLTGAKYGAAATFSVASSTGALGLSGATYNGTDVAGSIDGVAATGAGQYLQAASSLGSLGGLELMITATGITSSTDLGTFSYTPMLAQQLASIAAGATDTTTGTLTTAVAGLTSQVSGLGNQITAYQARVTEEQAMLSQEFSNMETQLSSLNSTGQWLTQYLDSMNKSSS